MVEIKAPNKYNLKDYDLSIFLAGSIEQNLADNWQASVVDYFKDTNILILNPRRDCFDNNQPQSINNSYFREQVEWELDAQDDCDIILMYFDPNTKSPITLLELGLYALKLEFFVCCSKDFWRRGNVEIVCKRYEIPFYEDLDTMLKEVKASCLETIKFQNKQRGFKPWQAH